MRRTFYPRLSRSGTTAVQSAWNAAGSEPGRVWFPKVPPQLTVHHAIAWGIAVHGRGAAAVGLECERMIPSPPVDVTKVVERAEQPSSDHVLSSSAEFDRITPAEGRDWKSANRPV